MKTQSLKRAAVAGIAALALVGAALGVAGAQQTPTTPTRPGPSQEQRQQHQQHHEQFLAAVAKKLNVSTDALKQAFADARKELGIPERRAGGPGGFGHGRGPGFFGGLDVAAKAIGISVDQLRQEWPGKSLGDVAKAHNVDPATVAKALKDDANAKIDQAAAAGRIPSDRVAQAKQQAAERIDRMMTQPMPAGGPPQRGPQRGPRQ